MPLRTIEQIRADSGHLLEPGYRFLELSETIASGDRRLNSSREWGPSVLVGQNVGQKLQNTSVLAYARRIETQPPYIVGDGYRLLGPDEPIVEDTDERWDEGGNPDFWLNTHSLGGSTPKFVMANYKFVKAIRRKLDPLDVVVPDFDETWTGEWEDCDD